MNMSAHSVNRSGTLLIIAGILIAGPMLFHPDDTRPDFAFQAAWVPVHVLMAFGSIAAIAGLTGLYGALRSKIKAFGQVAFGLAILGTVLFTGLLVFVESTLLPVLGRNPAYGVLLSESGPLMGGPFGIAVMGSLAVVSLGYVLLAIYLAASKTISIVNALFFIGAPFAAFAPPLPYVLEIIGGVMFGIAVILLGISVRFGTAHKALEEEMKIQDECLAHAGGHA
jgi:hypothetical protein